MSSMFTFHRADLEIERDAAAAAAQKPLGVRTYIVSSLYVHGH